MEVLNNYFKKENSIHHFILIEGDFEEVEKSLTTSLSAEFSSNLKNNNLFLKKFEKFLIEDARYFKKASQSKNKKDQKFFYVLFINSINENAQNALLKILEEPVANTHFILVFNNSLNILDTVLSRAFVLKTKSADSDKLIKDLISKSFEERQNWMKEVLDQIENGELSRGFLQQLNLNITEYLKKDAKNYKLISKFDDLGKYLNKPDISLKFNLEVMLTLLPYKK